MFFLIFIIFLVHGADWFPTLLDAAGIDIRENLKLDGVSQWNAL